MGFFLQLGLSGTPTLSLALLGVALAGLTPIKAILFFLLLTRLRLRSRTSLLISLSLASTSEFGLLVRPTCLPKRPWIQRLPVNRAKSWTRRVRRAGTGFLDHHPYATGNPTDRRYCLVLQDPQGASTVEARCHRCVYAQSRAIGNRGGVLDGGPVSCIHDARTSVEHTHRSKAVGCGTSGEGNLHACEPSRLC